MYVVTVVSLPFENHATKIKNPA